MSVPFPYHEKYSFQIYRKINNKNKEIQIAELQIKPKKKSDQTKNLEGTIIAWFLVVVVVVTLRTVLMLLWPLKMLTNN